MANNKPCKRILIDLSFNSLNILKIQADLNNLSRKKYIESLLESEAVKIKKRKLPYLKK